MSATSALSITDPERILHKFQQVIATGKFKRTPQCVATLEASIYPMKAKIEISFKKFQTLPISAQEDLKKRFNTEVDGITHDKIAFHLIPLPLQTLKDLSQEDMVLSLSRSSGQADQFPLVTNLEWDIKTLDSKEKLSENEKHIVETIRVEVGKSFPNVRESKESITFIGKANVNI